MKQRLHIIFLSLFFFTLFIGLVYNPTNIYAEAQRYIIGFSGEMNEQLIESHQGTIEHRLEMIQAVSALLPKESSEKLKNHPGIAYIEKDAAVTTSEQSIDWGVKKINAPVVWDNGLTGKGVKVAIIDTGVANHPDLHIKEGVSFVNYTSSYEDDSGHGTHVAGVIAAQNNSIGVIGIAHEVDLYAIKVLNKEGKGYHSSVIKGIEWAVDRGVDIINLSVGGSEPSTGLEKALDHAYNSGVLIIAAAGNNGNYKGIGENVEYPAAYPTVIAVAATDVNDRRAFFSSTGKEVEVAAPGVSIRSTYLEQRYEQMSGTSMAAPHVTGHLALLKQAKPEASHTELRKLLHEQTLDLGPIGKDMQFGNGRIQLPLNLQKERAKPHPPEAFTATVLEKTATGAKIQLQWQKPKVTDNIKGYRLYRNGEQYEQLPSNQFSFVDIVPLGEYSYQMTTIGEEEVESNETAIKYVTVETELDDTVIDFVDLYENDWFSKDIVTLYKEKIIYGYEDKTIRPKEQISRAEATVMVARALNITGTPYANLYNDVSETHYAATAIQAISNKKVISGYPDGTFRPNAPITRGEVVAMLNQAFSITSTSASERQFSDVSEDYFAKNAISKLTKEGLVAGYPDGTFHPHAPITRGEFAAMLVRTMEYANKIG